MNTLPIVILSGPAGSGKDFACDQLQDLLDGPVARLAQADPMKRCIQRLWPEFSEDNLWGPTLAREQLVTGTPPYWGEALVAVGKLCDEVGLLQSAGLTFRLQRWVNDCNDRYADGGLTVRHAAQQLGTEVVRVEDPNTWNRWAIEASFQLLCGFSGYDRERGLFPRDPKTPIPHLVGITDGRFHNEILGTRRAGGMAVKLVGRRSGQVGNAGHSSETSLNEIPDHFFSHIVDNSGSAADLREQLGVVLGTLTEMRTMAYARLVLRGGGRP